LNALAQAPDSQTLRSLGAQLLRDDLIVFPVRHHSPACAFHLSRLIRERRPSLVLVEGPRSFDPLISLLTDESARLPLAIYTYAVGRATGDEPPPRHAAYYPFCDYSPELVALRLARELSIPARFIDLDFAEQCQIEAQQNDEEARSLMNERHLERSAHLRLLAGRLGCRDHEELWEHLFECQAPSHELSDHVANVAAYCQLARYDWSDEELQRDGTLAREAEMAWHIREGLKERDPASGPVLAVLGGFHAVVLPDLVQHRVVGVVLHHVRHHRRQHPRPQRKLRQSRDPDSYARYERDRDSEAEQADRERHHQQDAAEHARETEERTHDFEDRYAAEHEQHVEGELKKPPDSS